MQAWRCGGPSWTLRHSLLDVLGSSAERVGGLAVVEWNDVTRPFGAVDGQDRAKDQLCVRLISIRFSHDE
jgi:hypothetical protein